MRNNSPVMMSFWRECSGIERFTLIVGVAALAFFSGWNYFEQRSTAALPPLFEAAPKTHTTQGAAAENSSSIPSSRDSILVHVVGAVCRPGVFTLPAGARVQDAVKAAGGPLPQAEIHAINLAARLEDGGQVHVATRQEVATKHSKGASTVGKTVGTHDRVDNSPPPNNPINVNTASVAELESLPGIGPALARRISEYRERNGRFNSAEDLDAIPTLGPKKIERLRPHITF